MIARLCLCLLLACALPAMAQQADAPATPPGVKTLDRIDITVLTRRVEGYRLAALASPETPSLKRRSRP